MCFRSIAGSGPAAAGVTLLLALDIQFLYASHFARQEILLVLIFLLSLYLYLRGRAGNGEKWFRWSALTIGLGIGIHPNSFLIALPVGGFLLLDLFATGRSGPQLRPGLRRLGEYLLILSLCAVGFIALSYLMDPRFLQHYTAFGDTVGVSEPLYMKFFTFPDFYEKIFRRISGTYYTPEIRFQFYLFGGILLLTPLWMIFRPRLRMPAGRLLFGIFMINLGTLVLGKYSQPSIILHFPLYYLLLGEILTDMGSLKQNPLPRAMPIVLAVLLTIQGINTGFNLAEVIGPQGSSSRENYNEYTGHIAEYIPPDARVLANLNAEYYFDFGVLRDYRNLAYLRQNRMSFAGYIKKNRIEYIIYPEEMDVIHARRPVWNILYGNVTAYYREMRSFLADNCEEIGTFSSPVYAMRITRYSGQKDWAVKVYRVREQQD